MGGSTEDPAQDVTSQRQRSCPMRVRRREVPHPHRIFSGRTVKWQGVPERRCALGRITVKAKTKDKVFARAREPNGNGGGRTVLRRPRRISTRR